MSSDQIEDIKHIFMQALVTSRFIDVALGRLMYLCDNCDDYIVKQFVGKYDQFPRHMAIMDILYNYLVLPNESIFKELKHIPLVKERLNYINTVIAKNVAKVNPEGANKNNDLLRRLRNALAHNDITFIDGGFDFHDKDRKEEKEPITFTIYAENLRTIVNALEQKIIIPFINWDIHI